MKKRILCFLLCAVTLLSLVSCANEKYDLLYSVNVGDVTYCVRGSGTQAKQIVVKKGDEILWAKKVKVDSKVGNLGETYGFEATDLNFDGVTDFMIACKVEKDCTSYLCYVWSAEKETYLLSEDLGKLYNVKADPELKAIFGFSRTHEEEKGYLDAPPATIDSDIATKYIWKDGKLLPQMRTSVTFYSATNYYLYSVAYYNAETKEWTDDFYNEKWFTPEEYAKQDLSFLYYFK
ncbi:MAG: hypothetical protein IKJ35_08085 [Clostridia bacterium]|nr:hypothetical protein [Clostridia bacterium]